MTQDENARMAGAQVEAGGVSGDVQAIPSSDVGQGGSLPASCVPSDAQGSPARNRPGKGTPLWRDALQFVIAFAVMFGVIWLLRIYVIEPFTIPTGSMLPTIQLNDSVYAEKITLALDEEPQVGQVYVFTSPTDPDETLIKRVIAVGGQTIDLRDGDVYVDGVKLDEPYVHGQATVAMRSTAGVTYPYTIPEGEFWVMGDNRGNSSDSRVFGSVSYDNLIGRAVCRYWPLVRMGDPVEVDMGLFTFTAYPLELNIGPLDYTS